MGTRPSKAHRWGPCPGSVSLELAAPPDPGPPDPINLEGKAAHWVAERCAGSWAGHVPLVTPADFIGQTHVETGVIIDDDLAYVAGVYLRFLRERFDQYPAGLRIEEQISCHAVIPGNAGRADATWVNEPATWLTVADLKGGFKPVRAFGNLQLVNYAIGKLSQHPSIETLELVVIQPRGASAAQPVKTWQLSRADFAGWQQLLIEADAIAFSHNPTTAAGSHCHHCRAADACPTLQSAGMRAIDASRESIRLELTDAELGHELNLLQTTEPLLEARLHALEGLAAARIDSGKRIPGFEVSQRLANRSWQGINPELLGHLNGVDLVDHKPVSPRQAEARGIPRPTIDLFTVRRMGASKLRKIRPNEARDVFRTKGA